MKKIELKQGEAKEICRQVEEVAKELNISEEQAYEVYKERLKVAEGYGDYLIAQKEKGLL